MHVLFIDDTPEFKVSDAVIYLNELRPKFTYDICRSVNSALNYIFSHDSINLIVLDLGLPKTDDSNCFIDYDKYAGLTILKEIYRTKKTIKTPIIINSDTKINFGKEYDTERDYFNFLYGENTVIEHVDRIEKNWLQDFVSRNVVRE